MEIKYPNTSVVISDPQDRFESDKDISVTMKYVSQENQFRVTVPEVKKKESKPKAQPTKVYEGTLKAVKGTIKVDGNLKVGVDISPEKAKAIGFRTLKTELNEALDATWSEAVGN